MNDSPVSVKNATPKVVEPAVISFASAPEMVKVAFNPGTAGSGKMVVLSRGGLPKGHCMKVVALL